LIQKMPILLIVFFLLVVFSSFFSALEAAFLSIDKLRIKFLEKRGDKKAKKMLSILNFPESFLSTILVGNNLINISAASVSVLIFTSFQLKKEETILYSTIFTTVIILIFGEILPKTFAAYNADKVVGISFYPFRLAMILLYPISKTFSFLSKRILKFFLVKKTPALHKGDLEEELEFLLKENPWKEMIPKERKEMLERVFDIKRILVKEVMIPRVKVVGISIESSLQEIMEIVKEAEFSRYPVFKDSLENIEGIIHAKDLLDCIANPSFSIRSILREAYFVPETAYAEEVLKGMRKRKVHMAIVTDEWGGMVGVVTLEDILEELVGEIQDEYDEEEEGIKEVSENEFIISGSVSIKNAKKKIGIKIPEKRSYVTLAGFLMSKLEKIPSKGDILFFDKAKFVIEEMTGYQIRKVRVIIERDGCEKNSDE
ncbi:MAG: hemolysin family protein, partial [Candidatus Aminicenantia bacterium]